MVLIVKTKKNSPASPKVEIPKLEYYAWGFPTDEDLEVKCQSYKNCLEEVKNDLYLGQSIIIWKLVPIEVDYQPLEI